MKKDNVIQKESKLNYYLISFIVVLLLSSAFTVSTSSAYYLSLMQPLSILHSLIGVAFLLFSIYYLYVHFKRTLGMRSFSLNLTGLLLSLSLLIINASGFLLLFWGNNSSTKTSYYLHIISITFFFIFLITHIVFKVKFSKKEKKLLSINRTQITKASTVALIIIGIGMGLSVYFYTEQKNNFEQIVANYKLDYGENVFAPSQTTTDKAFIHKDLLSNSAQCASCHTDIFNQWKSSMHKHAASDPAYVKNINLLESKKGIAATRYCEGCHAPIALLSGELTDGGSHGGTPETIAFDEGISCLSCHTITTANHTKGVASYHIKPYSPDLLFPTDQNNILSTSLHNLSIDLNAENHAKKVSNSFQKTSEFCATCHSQFMDKDMNNWGWVKMQDEYSAWLNSSYSATDKDASSHQKRQNCQSCHMPLVESDDPAAKNGFIRSHRFATANSLIPMITNDSEQMQAVKEFLQSDKVQISIVLENREDAIQTGLSLDEDIRNINEKPEFAYLGEEVEFKVIVQNKGVGHDFPGGTIDLSEAWIEILVTDEANEIIYQSGSIDEKGVLSDSAVVYKSIPVDRSGKEVWKHDLFNMVGESYKKVITSGESDIETYKFKIPYYTSGNLKIYASINYRKLNTRYISWVLDRPGNPLPVISLDSDIKLLPIFETKPVKNTN